MTNITSILIIIAIVLLASTIAFILPPVPFISNYTISAPVSLQAPNTIDKGSPATIFASSQDSKIKKLEICYSNEAQVCEPCESSSCAVAIREYKTPKIDYYVVMQFDNDEKKRFPEKGNFSIIVTGFEKKPSNATIPPIRAPECIENWLCGSWSSCAEKSQGRSCVDLNNCGATKDKPPTSQSCTEAVVKAPAKPNATCEENWACTSWSSCIGNSQMRICTDQNSCGTATKKPIESQACTIATTTTVSTTTTATLPSTTTTTLPGTTTTTVSTTTTTLPTTYSLSITSPVSGAQIQASSPLNIQWTMSPSTTIGEFQLYYDIGGGWVFIGTASNSERNKIWTTLSFTGPVTVFIGYDKGDGVSWEASTILTFTLTASTTTTSTTSTTTTLPTTCSPNWVCSSWSQCSGGLQTRTCTDSNSCGTTTGKPAESQSCKLEFCGTDYYGKINGPKPCICGDSSCSLDFCWNGKSCLSASPKVSQLKTTTALFTGVKTCIVGDTCVSSNCYKILSSTGTEKASFEINSNLMSLKPSDPSVNNYQKKYCLETALDAVEIQNINSLTSDFASKMNEYSSGSINIQTGSAQIGSAEFALEKVVVGTSVGFSLSPTKTSYLVSPYVTKDTDTVFAVWDTHDSSKEAYITTSFCDLAWHSPWGVGGAGYVELPKTPPWTSSSSDYGCLRTINFVHGFGHNTDYALYQQQNVPHPYGNAICSDNPTGYPSCGSGVDPKTYYPCVHDAEEDPSFDVCKSPYNGNWNAYCAAVGTTHDTCNSLWQKHRISAHYNSAWNLLVNHCRDGRKNAGEVGIDCGGSDCTAC